MKTLWLLSVLSISVFVTSTRAAEKDVKLMGVTAGLDTDVAIIQVQVPPRQPEDIILKAGQAMNGVEVQKIEAAKGTVNVYVDGEARTLTLEEDPEHPSTNTTDRASLPVIHFHSIPLNAAIILYTDYKNRTMMQHPQLGHATFSLDASPSSKEEAAEIFEKMFNEQNIATIPDGEHFLMIVPFAFTNAVEPRAAALVSTNSLLPEGSVNFHNAPLDMVLTTYADYVHKDIVNLHDSSLFPRLHPTFTFHQTTPLSREELYYALETQFAWLNIRVVPDGDKWKLERVPERN